MSYIYIFILIGAIQGFLLSLIFFIKKNILFHKLFACILFTISLALFLAYLQNVLDYKSYTFLIKVSLPLSLVFIPGLLIYLKKLTGSFKDSFRNWVLLFLPFLLVVIYNIPFYFGSNELKISYFIRNEQTGNPLLIETLENIFVELSVVFFSFRAIVEAKNYKQQTKQVLSNLSKAKGGWIQFIAYSMFILSFFAIFLSVSSLFFNNVPLELNFITAVGSTVVIYFMAYYLLASPEGLMDISQSLKKIENSEVLTQEFKTETKNSPLLDYEKKIILCLEVEKLYLNPNLTLTELADKTGIPTYLTSKVINQNLKTNFYSLINTYRLEHVKRELLKQTNETIIEKAYNSGYNSKTTFYDSFKKGTGVSPSDFIKNNSG